MAFTLVSVLLSAYIDHVGSSIWKKNGQS